MENNPTWQTIIAKVIRTAPNDEAYLASRIGSVEADAMREIGVLFIGYAKPDAFDATEVLRLLGYRVLELTYSEGFSEIPRERGHYYQFDEQADYLTHVVSPVSYAAYRLRNFTPTVDRTKVARLTSLLPRPGRDPKTIRVSGLSSYDGNYQVTKDPTSDATTTIYKAERTPEDDSTT